MFLVFFEQIEMQIMEWFYKIGNSFFTIMSYLISQMGGAVILIGIIGITYWCINKEKGEKMWYAILTSLSINGVLKSFFNFKRPFEYENHEHLQKLKDSSFNDSATGSSFPSGHSQNAGALYTSIMLNYPRKWIKIVCVILMILISISRLYLGVHFPSDVITGLLIGITIATLAYFIINKFYKKRLNVYFITLAMLTPFVCLNTAEDDFIKSYGLLLGFAFGTLVEHNLINFSCDIPLIKRFIRFLIGFFLVGICFVLTRLIPSDIRHIKLISILIYGSMAFLAIGVVPFTFKSKRNPNGI